MEVINPNALVREGTRLIVHAGNAGVSLSYPLSGMDSGTFFWGVQTIDQSFAGGDFSAETSFTITGTGVTVES
ncbi:MAG: hypothetical protein PHU97_07495 [Bacteroidales bacterium]|nr:hypothetical protein [Bacteroidales bacterium]MDD3011145.1 hypothetical protein [Bacteroidales bacterium]